MSQPKTVISVGSANAEKIVDDQPDADALGGKSTGKPVTPLLGGGSSINHACRLLAQGVPAVPVVPLVADEYGIAVQKCILAAAETGNLPDLATVDPIAEPDECSTGFSTIFDPRGERKIVTEYDPRMTKIFGDKAFPRFEEVWRNLNPNHQANIGAVMIGHIHPDSRDERIGSITTEIVKFSKNQGARVYANLGRSQLGLGRRYWETLLGDAITFLQLDVAEVKRFYKLNESDVPSDLPTIFDWAIRKEIPLIVTMAELGAAGTIPGKENVVFVSGRRMPVEEIVDQTGAGDAFAAGFVANLLRDPIRDDVTFKSALEEGCVQGGFACKRTGGASRCPTRPNLDSFKGNHPPIRKSVILNWVDDNEEIIGRLAEYDLIFRRWK